MEIKLIALDLDGTLLDSRKCLSDVNRQALFQCIQKGIFVVPATGRTVDGIPEEIKEIPGVRYAITTNGAVIEDMKTGSPVDVRLLSGSLALELLRLIDRYHVMYDPYIDRRGITEPRFIEHLQDYSLSEEMQQLVLKTRDVHPNIIEFVEKSQKPVEKINLFFRNAEEKKELRSVLETRKDILITSSMPLNLEINALGATKGEAIIRLASHLGIKREEIMAAGDGENDLSMLRQAGIGVAMGNGSQELFAEADFITETNDRNGVAAAISRFFFDQEG